MKYTTKGFVCCADDYEERWEGRTRRKVKKRLGVKDEEETKRNRKERRSVDWSQGR